MSANEKHDATYHGGEYTPSLEEIRRHWGLAVGTHRRNERLAEFNRMIAKVRAEAKREALEEALEDAAFDLPVGMSRKGFYKWLRARANQYKENQ